MQHSLVKRQFVETLPGNFYQSLFPDYYATLSGVLKASRFVFYPDPMVVIGITRKSHGYYYFNDRMSEAKNILHNDDINRQKLDQIEDLLIPGMDWIQIGWLSALRRLSLAFQEELSVSGIQIDLSTIRRDIIQQSIQKYHDGQLSEDVYEAIKKTLTTEEYRRFFLPAHLHYSTCKRFGVLCSLEKKIRAMLQGKSQFPVCQSLLRTGSAKNILDIVQKYPTTFKMLKQGMSQDIIASVHSSRAGTTGAKRK